MASAISQFWKWSLAENDRARAERRTEGLIRVVTTKKGIILGASILAPAAGEMIAAWSLAISSQSEDWRDGELYCPLPHLWRGIKTCCG